MEPATPFTQVVDSSKQLAQRLFVIGENRLELLVVELQEERERLLRATILMLGVVAFGFIAVLALNVAIVVLLWKLSPVAVLLTLTSLYAAISFFLYQRFTALLRNWKSFSATLDQLRKDCECLEKHLS